MWSTIAEINDETVVAFVFPTEGQARAIARDIAERGVIQTKGKHHVLYPVHRVRRVTVDLEEDV